MHSISLFCINRWCTRLKHGTMSYKLFDVSLIMLYYQHTFLPFKTQNTSHTVIF
uniref:Uncharacterized protein n=1 Tax=Solanum lycopersicum TaxID=4081 RepID=A0A3Q7IF97_SOLLC